MTERKDPSREEQERALQEEQRKAAMRSKSMVISGARNLLSATLDTGRKEIVSQSYEGTDISVYSFNRPGRYSRTYSYTDKKGRTTEGVIDYFIGTPTGMKPEDTVFQHHEVFPPYLLSLLVLCQSEIDAGRLQQRKIGDDVRTCVTISLDRYLALQGLEGCDHHTRQTERRHLFEYAMELMQVGCHEVTKQVQADGSQRAVRWSCGVAVSDVVWDDDSDEVACAMGSTFLKLFRHPGGSDADITSKPIPTALIRTEGDTLEHAVYRYLIQQYTNTGMVMAGRHTHVRFSSLQGWLIDNLYIARPRKGDSASFRTKYQAVIKALDRLERDTETFSYTLLREDSLDELDLTYTALPDKEKGSKGGLIYSPGRKSKEIAKLLDRCLIEIAMDELDPYAESVRQGWKKKRRRKAKAQARPKENGTGSRQV